jgi:hypothetical protein
MQQTLLDETLLDETSFTGKVDEQLQCTSLSCLIQAKWLSSVSVLAAMTWQLRASNSLDRSGAFEKDNVAGFNLDLCCRYHGMNFRYVMSDAEHEVIYGMFSVSSPLNAVISVGLQSGWLNQVRKVLQSRMDS